MPQGPREDGEVIAATTTAWEEAMRSEWSSPSDKLRSAAPAAEEAAAEEKAAETAVAIATDRRLHEPGQAAAPDAGAVCEGHSGGTSKSGGVGGGRAAEMKGTTGQRSNVLARGTRDDNVAVDEGVARKTTSSRDNIVRRYGSHRGMAAGAVKIRADGGVGDRRSTEASAETMTVEGGGGGRETVRWGRVDLLSVLYPTRLSLLKNGE